MKLAVQKNHFGVIFCTKIPVVPKNGVLVVLLPAQVTPLPSYPVLHAQLKEPTVSVQSAFV